MLDKLFEFPIILVDVENEENKQKENNLMNKEEGDTEYDIIEGRAEYPYYDFLGVEDRWIPTSDGVRRAIRGKFDACVVKFANVPQFLVPWTRSKFKQELQDFITKLKSETEQKEQSHPNIPIIKLSPTQLAKIQNIINEEKRDDNIAQDE